MAGEVSAKVYAEEDDGDGDPDVREAVACTREPVIGGPFEITESNETIKLPGGESGYPSSEACHGIPRRGGAIIEGEEGERLKVIPWQIGRVGRWTGRWGLVFRVFSCVFAIAEVRTRAV